MCKLNLINISLNQTNASVLNHCFYNSTTDREWETYPYLEQVTKYRDTEQSNSPEKFLKGKETKYNNKYDGISILMIEKMKILKDIYPRITKT